MLKASIGGLLLTGWKRGTYSVIKFGPWTLGHLYIHSRNHRRAGVLGVWVEDVASEREEHKNATIKLKFRSK